MQSWRHPFCGPPPCTRSGIHVLGVDSSPAAVNASGTQKRTASEGSSCRADSGIAFTLHPASLPFGVVGVHRIAPLLSSLIAQPACGPPLQRCSLGLLGWAGKLGQRPWPSFPETKMKFRPLDLGFTRSGLIHPFEPRLLLLNVLTPAPAPRHLSLERRAHDPGQFRPRGCLCL